MSAIITSGGSTVILPSDDAVLAHLRDPKSYAEFIIKQINEEHIYDKWLKNKTDLVILDIGANVGLFTVYAQDAAKRLVAVEPTPAHHAIFEKITADYPHVELVKAALTENDAPVTFFISKDNSTVNSLVYKTDTSIEVQGICFKTLLDTYNLDYVDFAKIDIEGGETLALTVDNLVAIKDRVGGLFVECHCTAPPWSYPKVTVARDMMRTILDTAGFETEIVDFATVFATNKPKES